MNRTRSAPAQDAQAPAAAPAALGPSADGGAADAGNAARAAALIDAQLAEPDVSAHGTSVLEAACKATNRMFVNDPGGFVNEQLALLTSLEAMREQHARMEGRDKKIDADAGVDPRYGEAFQQRIDRLVELPKPFTGTYGLGGWLLPTHYGPDGERPLIGAFDREGSSPAIPKDSAGIGAWERWSEDRGAALEDLMARAGEVVGWCDAHGDALWDAYDRLPALAWIGLGFQHPAPAQLTDAKGREYLYLLEVMKDELPDDIVDLCYGRDRGEVVMEQEALDKGVDPARLPELDALVAEISAVDDAVGGLDDLKDLAPDEQAYVLRQLRWSAGTTSGFMGFADALDDEGKAELEQIAGGAGMGYAVGDGTWDTYDKTDCAIDMAKGLPGAIGNVGYGMLRSVPIAGDLMDRYVGEDVDSGLQWLNEDVMGLDHYSSEFQEQWGQTAGIVAGSIGVANAAAWGGATLKVGSKAVELPAWLSRTVMAADVGYNGFQAASGTNAKGEQLEDWQRWMAGVSGVLGTANGVSGYLKADAAAAPASEALTQAQGRTMAAEFGTRAQPDLVSEAYLSQARAAEQAAAAQHSAEVAGKVQTFDDFEFSAMAVGLMNGITRSAAEAWGSDDAAAKPTPTPAPAAK